MRKQVATLLTVVYLVSLSLTANASVKPGTSCKKIGQTSISSGTKYTCIKSGKKLVWNKGVVIKKLTPYTPTPTLKLPSAGDPPLPFDGCGSGWYYFRINNGVMERSFYPDKGYVNSDPRPLSSFDPIRVKAYEAIRNHKSTNTTLPKIEYRIAKSFPSDVLSYLKFQLEPFVAYWSDRFKPNAKIIATFTTEKEVSLLNPEVTSNYEDLLSIADVYLDPSKVGYLNCGWRSGLSGAHTLWSGPNYGTIGFAMVFPSKHDGTHWLPKNLPHEITHGIQDLIWISDEYPYSKKNVYNLIEGGAELFSTGFAYSNIGWYNDAINSMIVDRYVGFAPTKVIPQNTEDVLKMLNTSEINDNSAGTQWAYTVGFHLWEYLIANYGFDSYWEIARNIQKADSYDDAIKKSIGISKSNLYADAAPYILKQFKIALAAYDNK